MKYVDECGEHTHAIFRHGLRQMLPPTVELRSGPGCPVCVTANADIDRAIALANLPGVIMATFGDTLGVLGSHGSLQTARAGGGTYGSSTPRSTRCRSPTSTGVRQLHRVKYGRQEMDPVWYIVNVEGAIVRDGRYLMVVRGEQESHASGVIAFPGGKVENAGEADNVLEETLRREIREEVGVEVHDDMVYVESTAFVADDGRPMVDVLFLCRYQSGEPAIGDPGEVAAVRWMTTGEILAHPRAPSWMRQSLERAEKRRLARGW